MPEPRPPAAPAARIAGNALAIAGSKVVTSLALFGWQIALARVLGPSTYGTYGAIGALLAVAAVLPDAGLGIVVARETAGRPSSAPRTFAATLVLQPLLGLVAAVLVAGLADRLGIGTGLGLLVPFAAFTLVTDTVGNVCHSQLVGAERLVAPGVIAIAHTSVLVSLGALLLGLGFGLWGVYGALIVASLVRASLYRRRVTLLGVRPEWPVTRPLVAGLLRDGWPIALGALVGLARLNVDKLVVARLLGAAATGQLQAAFVVVFGVVDVLGLTLLAAVFPVMARTFFEGPTGRFTHQVERLVTASLLVGAPLAFVGPLFAPQACRIFFGPAFDGSARLLVPMLGAGAAGMIGAAFAQALIVQGRQRTLLVARACALAAYLALLAVLVPRVGVVGAPIASLATEIAVLPFLALPVRLPAGTWKRMLGSGVKILFAAGFSAGAAFLLDPGRGFVALATALVLYPALVLAVRVVSPEAVRRLTETPRS